MGSGAETSQALTEFSTLIQALYAGPLEEQPWASFLEKLRLRMKAIAANLILDPPGSNGPGFMLHSRPPGWTTDYQDRFFASDPFVNLPEGRPVTISEFLPQEEFLASEFNRLFLEPTGVTFILGADVHAEGGMTARLRISRLRGDVDFGEEERALCAMLLPHLRQSIEIFQRLSRIASERSLYSGTLNQLAVGTIIIDGLGRILDKDPVAESLLREGDGLIAGAGRLALTDRGANARLGEALAKISDNERKGQRSIVEAIRAPRPSGRRELGLIVKPAPRPRYLDGQPVPAIVVFVNDPDRHTVMAPAALVKLFGLTPAEASVSVLLADGLTLDEAAEQLSISRNTARAHLRSIFAKTGVSRQTMLVRLIVTSLAQLGSEEAR